eukprot:325760-Rhodomonas_salina.4
MLDSHQHVSTGGVQWRVLCSEAAVLVQQRLLRIVSVWDRNLTQRTECCADDGDGDGGRCLTWKPQSQCG